MLRGGVRFRRSDAVWDSCARVASCSCLFNWLYADGCVGSSRASLICGANFALRRRVVIIRKKEAFRSRASREGALNGVGWRGGG